MGRATGGQSVTAAPIKNAASIILVREAAGPEPRVLMGQRGAQAAFMADKVVFPGGAVDPDDAAVPLVTGIAQPCATRLEEQRSSAPADALCAAAIRELWEETGLILGTRGQWPEPVPADWAAFATAGWRPSAEALHFVFRAVTPPGRPRRFDARFFLADAAALANDPDDFSHASGELAHLQWIPLHQVRDFALPFVTEVVLAEVARALPFLGAPDSVPFFDNGAEDSVFRRLGGVGPMQHYSSSRNEH
ncbi:MAG: NUDIX domain-containing protein [Pseudomonadota bacterium]